MRSKCRRNVLTGHHLDVQELPRRINLKENMLSVRSST